MGAQATQAHSGLELCWRGATRQMQSCSYEAKINSVLKARTFTLEPRRSRNCAAFGHYLLKSFRVLRSSTTYAIEARMPLPERTSASSDSSSPLQTGSVREPSPIHACSIFKS